MRMKPLLVILAPGFEEIELAAPVDILRRLGIEIVLAGLIARQVEGAHGIVMRADMLLVDAEVKHYDGIILPGGAASWLMRDSATVLSLVQHFHEASKMVAAICAAPIVLQAAGILNKRQVSCYPAPAVTDALTSVKSISNAACCTDGHIITARGPGASLEFGFCIGDYLGKEKEVIAMRQEMCME